MRARLTVLLCAAAALAGCGAERPRPAASAPNILIIVTDDQRLDQMDVMPRTRELFGREGVRFSNAYDETPLCCPSRASIFTGRYTHNHGVGGNAPADVARLDLDTTMQHLLHRAGYQTGIAGKFFNAWDLSKAPPDFDRWAITTAGYRNAPFQVDGDKRTIKQYSTDYIGDRALQMLHQFQRDPSRPWFLYVAPFAPHFPYLPDAGDATAPVPPQHFGPAVHERDLSDKPPELSEGLKKDPFGFSQAYVGELQKRTLLPVDRLVARLLAAVGAKRSTLAIFISDNGYLLGEHGIIENKAVPYPESVHVPMYMRWPGHVKPGTVDDRFALNADIAPTVLAAAHVKPLTDPPPDGRPLTGPARRDTLFLESSRFNEAIETGGRVAGVIPAWASIISGRLQYTQWYARDNRTVSFRELYDLRRDPDELQNLLPGGRASQAPRVTRLAQRLEKLRSCRGTAGPAACP